MEFHIVWRVVTLLMAIATILLE